MRQDVVNVINDYTDTVARTLALLEEKFGKVNYVSAKGSREISTRGFLGGEQEIPYNLHGIGITVDYPEVSIVFDFDFSSNDHCGFNAWQLERFVKINPNKYPELSRSHYGQLESEFEQALEGLKERGEVKFDRSKNRYYAINPPHD